MASIATENIQTDDAESSMASKIFGSDVEGDSNEDEVAITNVEAPPTVEPDPSARKKILNRSNLIPHQIEPVTEVAVPCQGRQNDFESTCLRFIRCNESANSAA